MIERRGFLLCDRSRDRYHIDWRESLSIVVGELLLQQILTARPFLKGCLLDVGCGKRPYALIYESLVNTSVGTEMHFSPHGTQEADTICDASALPFGRRSFDTILCTEVLEHTRYPHRALAEFARVLKPGGHLFLSVPFIYPTHEAPHDYWRFTSYGLDEICRCVGLNLVYVRAKGGVGTTLASLGVNLSVRGIDAVSRLLGLTPPLRSRSFIRFPLASLQWLFLKAAKQLGKIGRRPNWLAALDFWMSPGFVALVESPLEA